jgi:glycosyltransferase involved in cell wall biosynthesis
MRSMTGKPVILVFLHFYLPGYKSGGPIRTIANLVEALGDEFDFRIVTSDRDATDTEPYPGLPPAGEWARVGKADVLYLPPDRKNLRAISGILRDTPHDTLYLNSFFDPVFTMMPLLARVLALPRTALRDRAAWRILPGALRLKATKKRAYLAASRTLGLYRNLVWQASSEREAEDIRRVMGSAATDIRVAVDLPAKADPGAIPVPPPRGEGKPLRVVFLSRISPMKNLEFAIEALRQVQSPVTFDIYGPVRETDYWEHCRKLLAGLPPHVTASYRGGVEHDQVPSVLSGTISSFCRRAAKTTDTSSTKRSLSERRFSSPIRRRGAVLQIPARAGICRSKSRKPFRKGSTIWRVCRRRSLRRCARASPLFSNAI